MRGRRLRYSAPRRIVADLMYFSRHTPSIPAHRRMQLAPLVAARGAQAPRVPWTAIFAKAFACVADEMPALRRFHIGFPRPHLYEPVASTGSIAIERELGGEKAVLAVILKDPAGQRLADIASRIRDAAVAPVEEVKDFRRMIAVARLPLPIRRLVWWIALNSGRQRANYLGTFAVSAVSGWGTEITHPRSVFPVLLTYGVIDAGGGVDVRMVFDHRTLDGAEVARALLRLEELLVGEIARELREG